ncbi:type III-B CRISPR module RAMP protein Cmr6 [Thioalkalicoccus limnaeus]|uniref:Type III-B CRISPR module RAMP protein Cmr6 n=1 Tax=Thioalkalicoccus limnaeus TaxID=120681 RepID=A0ABV4BMD2_9GAMM
MAIAAVPHYLGEDFSRASPGLRFGMYLKLWGVNNRSGERLWTTHDLNYRVAGKDKQEREFRDENKSSALHEALKLSVEDRATMSALASRQAEFAKTLQSSGTLLRLETESVAPFATGLGNEHPLENGFAFLNPYGLPYLPGSGVKGVLRQAARELASGDWGDRKGWHEESIFRVEIGGKPITLSMVEVLFGRDVPSGETDHLRGALTFWDVYPQLKGNALQVEVMTPHQTHYYQVPPGETPHESGSPKPINFLTVPPGSGFAVHVHCDRLFLAQLAPDLAEHNAWKALMTAAFEHAFAWLGFGAKTAVGYGAMAAIKEESTGQDRSRLRIDSGATASEQLWSDVTIQFIPGSGELRANYQGKVASAFNPAAQRLRDQLPEKLQKVLAKKKPLKGCEVSVVPIGNGWQLAGILSAGGIDLSSSAERGDT